MIDLLIMLACFAITAAAVWRLATLPLPDGGWRHRSGHAAWVAAHILIAAGALSVASSLPADSLSKPSVLLVLVGLALLFLGRWRRRESERSPSQPRTTA